MKLTIENKHFYEYLKKVCKEEKVDLKSTLWQSRYNENASYSYEPFCSEGFTIIVDLGGDSDKLEFVKYLLENYKNNAEFLDNCLSV